MYSFFNGLFKGLGSTNSDDGRSLPEEAQRKLERAKKIKLIIDTAPVWGPVLGIVLVVFAVIIMCAGIFGGGSGSSGNYAYLGSKYSNCANGIVVEGKLYDFEEYIAGVVQHEAYTSEGSEALKAQAIAARSYALVYTNGCERAIGNSQASQTFDPNPSNAARLAAQDTKGLVLTYAGEVMSAMYDSFCYNDKDCPDAVRNADGSYTVSYTRIPSGEKHKITLSDSSQYGRIVPGGGHAKGMSQLVSYQLAKNGMTYEQILKYFYADSVQIMSIYQTGNSEIGGGTENQSIGAGYTTTYINSKTGKTYRNYKQNAFSASDFSESDFPSNSAYQSAGYFKRLDIAGTGAAWLKKVGCGVTSVAIVHSADDTKYTPQYLYGHQRYVDGAASLSKCLNYAKKPGVDYKDIPGTRVKNMKQELINHFNNGGTAIFYIAAADGNNYIAGTRWTKTTHFFAILDYDATNNTIYVSDPASYNRKYRMGWQNLDDFDNVEVAYIIY